MDDDESFICCPICSEQFVYPRVLPCGESICLACIMANTNQKVYNCKFCNKHHDVPNEGFPENRHLYKLIQSLESKLYRGPLYQELRLSLNNIEEIIRDVSQDLNNGKHEIHEYCLKLISEIDLNTEKLIDKINISRESLVSQVLNFEKESLDNFDMNSKSIKNHQSTLNEYRNLVEVEKNFLKSLNLNEEKLKDKISRVKTAEWRLHSEKRKLKNTLFKNFDLNFIPNKSWLQVGRIEKVNNFEIDLKKFREIDLEKHFSSKPDRYHTIEVEKMDNGNFVFFYLEQSSKNWIVEIHSFEEDRTFFRCLKEVTGEYLNYSRIKAFKNRILIYTCFKNSRILRICDENLKGLVCKACQYFIQSILCSDEKILCLLDKEVESKIVIYDWKLSELIKINNNSLFFYFPKLIENFYSNEEYYFFRESDCVNILNKNNGCLVKSFNLSKQYEIVAIDSTYLFTRKGTQANLEILDFNGELVENKILINFPKNSLKTFLDSKGSFVFVDCKNMKFFI